MEASPSRGFEKGKPKLNTEDFLWLEAGVETDAEV